jgi:ketosteroid isomerase-like protein
MTAGEVVKTYYASWTAGPNAFDEQRLRQVLHPQLDFRGSVAGQRTGAEPFIKGVANIARALKSFRMMQWLEQDDQVAAVYECDLAQPAGTFMFAEFFRVAEGRITSLNLSYDGTEFRKLSPAQPPAP